MTYLSYHRLRDHAKTCHIRQLLYRAIRLSSTMMLMPCTQHCAGTMSKAEIEDSYKISRRIEGEERGLDYATMVFTSTQQEVTF